MGTDKGNIADLSDWKVVHRGRNDYPRNHPETLGPTAVP